MRFKLLLSVDRKKYGDAIPLNYQYECSSAIYRILSRSAPEYAEWLHSNGFELGRKQFKLFTFSRFKIKLYEIFEDRLKIKSDTIEWYISFLPEISTMNFIQGIFSEQIFQIGDIKSKVQFKVISVELMPHYNYKPDQVFQTLTPICVSTKTDEGKIAYLSPSDAGVKELLLSNLKNRHRAFYGKEYSGELDFDFTLLNTPKPVTITIKANTPEETRVKGYMCRFRLNAPDELMRIAYESGIGEKNSMGFGMIELIDN